jgi:hypothetical protein
VAHDPRPASWRDRGLHELAIRRRFWNGRLDATCSCGSWRGDFVDADLAETKWSEHAWTATNAARDRRGLFSRSWRELWSGDPDPPP